MSHRFPGLLVAALIGAFVLLPFRPAAALSLAPAVLELQAKPGQTLTQAIRLLNEGAETVGIATEFANFMHSDGDESSGTPQLYPANEERDGRGLAPWMRIVSVPNILKSGEQANALFEIAVPETAEPGSHFGAVVLRQDAGTASSGVGLVGNLAALVILRVEGEATEDLRIERFAPERRFSAQLPVGFETRVDNRGTTHLRPHGSITITDALGRIVTVLPVNEEGKSVLPGSARRYQATWSKSDGSQKGLFARQWANFAIGPHRATIELRYGSSSQRLTAEADFWVFPWLVASIGGVLILLAAFAAVLWLRWYFRKVAHRAARPPSES